jgi:hypothetical protein
MEMKEKDKRGQEENTMALRRLRITADKRQNFILPKFLSATSFIRKTLSEIRLGGLSIDLKGWNQLWYYGESNHEPRN